MKQKIMVIDDEKDIRDLLFNVLTKNGYAVITAEDSNGAFEKMKLSKPDLILLDLNLPDINGFQFCQFLRKEQLTRNIPIIMLTCMDKVTSKVSGLEMGADDYITKPFDQNELLARIKATLRKMTRQETPSGVLTSGTLTVDPLGRTVRVGKEKVDLGPKEFDLLYLLMKGKGKVYSRNEILESIWGFEYLGNTRTVDVHIRYLRRKLKSQSKKIETVESIGYKFLE